jgi:hypothetical protein
MSAVTVQQISYQPGMVDILFTILPSLQELVAEELKFMCQSSKAKVVEEEISNDCNLLWL